MAPMGFNELAFARHKSKFFPPAWSQKLPAKKRFILVIGRKAVLDRETGLVWERSPSTAQRDWFTAIAHCYRRTVGGRGGWRLPTVEELRSLVDPTQSNPALPAGHPFLNVQSSLYWSATTNANLTSSAWIVSFNTGDALDDVKSDTHFVWCVRGGQGHDGGH